jgi:hypothetical protein
VLAFRPAVSQADLVEAAGSADTARLTTLSGHPTFGLIAVTARALNGAPASLAVARDGPLPALL